MRVGKFLIFATDENFAKAKDIIETKGHQAFQGKTVDDLVQFTCWWGKTTREDRCQVDGIYIVGKPDPGIISPTAVGLGSLFRALHSDRNYIPVMELPEDDWPAELERGMIRAEDCPDPGDEEEE